MTVLALPPGLDANLTAWRPDLAAASLRGRAPAARYAEGEASRTAAGTVPLRARPDAAAPLATELLFGEAFTVYERQAGWAWGQAEGDCYVGYVPEAALRPAGPAPTHRIAALTAFLFPAPDIKRTPLDALPLGAPVAVVATEGVFVQLDGGGWLRAVGLGPPEPAPAEPVATALRFLGAPYLWGGRTARGIDCSGLVQVALQLAGIACPRDSYMQREAVGIAVEPDPAAAQPGDLAFFPGHVGLVAEGAMLLHATAASMSVRLEPLAEAIARITAAEGRGLIALRRPAR